MRSAWVAICGAVLITISGCKKEEEKAPPAVTRAVQAPQHKPGDWVLIPEGEFLMGTDLKDKDNAAASPQRKVRLPAYSIHKFEVTNAEFVKFQAESTYVAEGRWRTFFSPERADHPVVDVTWNDAKAYCEWAGGRLPTEAEWEKAARGTEGFRYPWGNEIEPRKSNVYEAGRRGTVDVGSFPGDVSPYGVYDTLGNIQEWIADWYKAYPGGPADKDYGERFRVVRGASTYIKGAQFAIWLRSHFFPKALYGIGFRCAKDAPE